MKQRIGMRWLISSQPCRSTTARSTVSRVTPCKGSFGCEEDAVMCAPPCAAAGHSSKTKSPRQHCANCTKSNDTDPIQSARQTELVSASTASVFASGTSAFAMSTSAFAMSTSGFASSTSVLASSRSVLASSRSVLASTATSAALRPQDQSASPPLHHQNPDGATQPVARTRVSCHCCLRWPSPVFSSAMV